MIRRPSTVAQIYAWHRAAIAGAAPAIHDGLPEAGWYMRRMVKGGPWVPVRIYVVRDIDPETGELTAPERMVAEIGGKQEDPAPHWTHLSPISWEQYDNLIYRQSMIPAMAEPRQKIDLTKEPINWI
jgi:hypothetical protein